MTAESVVRSESSSAKGGIICERGRDCAPPDAANTGLWRGNWKVETLEGSTGCRGDSGWILCRVRAFAERRDSESEPPLALARFCDSLLVGRATGLGGGKGKMAWELGMEERLRGMNGRGDPAWLEWREKELMSPTREEWQTAELISRCEDTGEKKKRNEE